MTGRRILVVDDERIVAEDISECLRAMNCDVVATAISGPQAIDLASEHVPDLVMMDITLQGEMDGIEAARHIHDELGISSIFLTAYSDKAFLERAKSAHPAGYVVKPFDEPAVRAAVEIGLHKISIERALFESREWYQTTLMSIADGVITTDATGMITFANQAAEQILGLSNDGLHGKQASEAMVICREDSGAPVENLVYAALDEREMVGEKNTVLHRADGKIIPIEQTVTSIRSRDGEVLGAALVIRDVTHRRESEQQLIDYQNHLEDLVSQRTQRVLQTNTQLQAEVEERARAEKALQKKVELESLHASLSALFVDLKHSDLRAGLNTALGRIGRTANVESVALFLIEENRETVSCDYEWCASGISPIGDSLQALPLIGFPWLMFQFAEAGGLAINNLSVVPDQATMTRQVLEMRDAKSVLFIALTEGDKIVGFVAAIMISEEKRWNAHDISMMRLCAGVLHSVLKRMRIETDKEQLQMQLTQSQKMEAVGKLSGGIAHDFNNMLQPIIGYADMLISRYEVEGEEIIELREIRRAAVRAATLTRQLLAFSRKQIIKKVKLDINQEIEDMQNMLDRIIGENIHLKTDLAEELSLIHADPGQMEQVLMNLVVNARDAMIEGGLVRIETDMVQLTEESAITRKDPSLVGDYVCIRVTDEGGGIAENVVNRIFEPFFTTKGLDGTGLGLSVVYGIIEQHQGGIYVESKENEGTTFSIYLPAIPNPDISVEDSSTVQGSEEQSHQSGNKGNGERILLIEDEEGVIKFVSSALRSCGYEIVPAMNFREALKCFEEGEFDLVFSDAVLPDGNGVDLLGRFLDERPNTRALLSSGYTDKMALMKKEKDISFLQKPYSLPQLYRTVREVLDDDRSHLLS